MQVGDVIEWKEEAVEPHHWRVRGIHLGAVGVESIIEIENVSHKPGWTGEWETHQMMFVPEVLLRGTRVVQEPTRRPGNSKLVYDKKRRTIVTVRTPWWRRALRRLGVVT